MVLNTLAAKYRHRITINNPPADSSRDTFGRRKGAGTTVATVWAEKTDWQGGEATQQGREVASVTTKWRIRYRTDVQPKMQIVEGSETYDILDVLDFDGKKRELLLTSRRVVS